MMNSYNKKSMHKLLSITMITLCSLGMSTENYASMVGQTEPSTPSTYVYSTSGVGGSDGRSYANAGSAINYVCSINPHDGVWPNLYSTNCPGSVSGVDNAGYIRIRYDWEVLIKTGYQDDTGGNSIGIRRSALSVLDPRPDACENPTHSDGMDTDGDGEPNVCWENDTRNPQECSDGDGPPDVFGNPVSCTSGDKQQREVIYQGADGLSLVLDYSSRTGDWRTGYGLWLEGVDEPTIDAKALHIPGGFVNGYYLVETLPDATRIFRADSGAQGEIREASDGTYTYIDSSGVVHRFNGFGYVEQITQLDGRSETLSYIAGQDAAGLISSVTNSFGRTLTFTYDTNGFIDSVTDPDGNLYDLQFSASGSLQQIIWPDDNGDPLDNPTRQFLYEDTNFPNALTGIIDEHGARYATYAYDPVSGKATLTEHAGGAQKLTLDYVTEEQVTPDGFIIDGRRTDVYEYENATNYHRRIYTFQKFRGIERITQIQTLPLCSGCPILTERWEYDPITGFLTRHAGIVGDVVNPDENVTDYIHNSRGLEERRTEGAGTPEARTVTTSWHPDFDQPTLITEPARSTAYSYNSAGQVLTETIIGLTSGNTQITTYTYEIINGISLLKTIDGPRTDVTDITTLNYDVLGNLTDIDNALGHTTTITSRDASGRPTGLLDANGLLTSLTYDARGRLDTQTIGGTRLLDIDYDAAGNVRRITQPDGSFIDYGYDTAQRLTSIADSFGNQIVYTLNALGDRTAERVYGPTSTLRRQIDRVYNSLGQLTAVIGAAAQTWQFSYDKIGNRVSAIDPRLNATSYAFDALNRLITVTDDLSNSSRYGYDGQNQLVSVTDPNSNTTSYQYDDLGNLLQLVSPDTGITTYSNYDGAGNAGQMVDANGNTTTYQYDALNRLTLATYQDGTATQYVYDDPLVNAIGRLSQVIDESGSVSYQYNPFGDVTQLTQTVGSQTLVTTYHYNPVGQLSGIDYPSGMSVAYSYSQGRISGIDINGQPLLNTINYYPFGPAESWTWGNGAANSRSFDLDGQMSQYSLNGDSQTLSYDPTGNLQTRTSTLGTLTYGYDDLNRLTSVTGLQTQAFQYDANGNRTQLTDGIDVSDYTVATNSNRITEITGVQAKTYTYDNNGNILNDGTNSFIYNARNRMASANGVSYLHNGLGQRTARQTATGTYYGDASNDGLIDQTDFDETVAAILETATPAGNTDCNRNGQTNVVDLVCLNNLISSATPPQEIQSSTYFAYDLQGQLIGEYGTDGNAIQETVYFGNMPVATVRGGTVYYIHTDQLNTPRAISDANNVTLWAWESTPFGETAANEDVDGDGNLFGYHLRFPGQYYDEETGLHYNYFRDYDPSTGRYITSDPIGLAGGLNTYLYASANPHLYTDPYGLFDLKKFIKKTLVTVAINTAVGMKVVGIGALFDPKELGCGDFTSDCDGDGIPDNERPEPPDDTQQCK